MWPLKITSGAKSPIQTWSEFLSFQREGGVLTFLLAYDSLAMQKTMVIGT